LAKIINRRIAQWLNSPDEKTGSKHKLNEDENCRSGVPRQSGRAVYFRMLDKIRMHERGSAGVTANLGRVPTVPLVLGINYGELVERTKQAEQTRRF
jgi:hypothetical protein